MDTNDKLVDLGNDHLVVLHNLSIDSLLFGHKIGGLASPSLGITKASTPYKSFGEVTLIGTKDMADPEKVPMYSSDAYTKRFPEVSYLPKVDKETAALLTKVRNFSRSGLSDGSEIEYRIVNHQFRTVSEFARLLKGSTAFRLALTGTDPVMKDYPYQTMAMHVPTFRGMAETGKFAAYLDEFMGNFEKASKENERYMSFSELVRGFNAEYLKSTGLDKKGIKNPLRRGEPMPIGMLDRLARDVKNASRQVIDEEASLKLATKAMPDAEYFAACDALAEKIYGHPMAKQGRKMVPLTAEIAAQMMGSGKRNLEKTMTFGAGKIKAMGAIKFRDFMHMTKSKGMLDTDENIEASHTETDKLQTKYRDGASDHYAYSNMWDALDDAMKALAIAGKKKNATTADLRRELTKLNFTTGEIPEDILQAGIDSLKAIHGSKVPYFEGKPERPVKLNEFVGAVVPDDAPNNVVELLQKHGLAVVKASYENRLAAVTSLANQLEKSKGGVMFESATGILESMTPEIRYLYDYLKSPAWEDLPFQMNYLLGRWLETQDIEFPEEAGTEDYEQIEWMRLHDKANYQAFGEWLETQDDEGDGQTKKYFDDNPKIVNNIWCLHFTDNADDVWREGFTFGTDDMELLGLTSFRRSVKNGKWGFAFDAANTSWRKYKGQHGGLKYGDSAVMFKASGVKVYHYSDDEDQVIFDTRTVTDIVQLEKISYPIDGLETSVWAVVDRKGHPLYHTGDNTIEDLDNAAMWVIKHYDQYKNAIHTGHAPAASRKAKFESEDDEVLKLSNNMIEIRMDSRPDVTGALDEIKNTYEQFERNRYLFTDAAMFEASRFGDSIYLTSVFVLPEERKSGLATKMMDAICDIVDRHNVNIVIFPKRMGNDGLTTPELKKWYAKFGFKNSDQGNMLRTPARVSRESINEAKMYDSRIPLEKQEPISESDKFLVYHGFYSMQEAILAIKYGLSGKERANRVYSYETVNNPNGLFVSISPKVVIRGGFASSGVMIEFVANVSDLEAPVWAGGGSYFVQGQKTSGFDDTDARKQQVLRNRELAAADKNPAISKSSRPELADTMLNNPEKQALYVGDLNPNMIRTVWVKNGNNIDSPWIRMTPAEFMKKHFDESQLKDEFGANREIRDSERYMEKQRKYQKPNDDFSIDVLRKEMERYNLPLSTFLDIVMNNPGTLDGIYYPKQVAQINQLIDSGKFPKE